MSSLRTLLLSSGVLMASVVLVGCPAGNYELAINVSTTQIDLGGLETQATFSASRVSSTGSMPTIAVTPSVSWLSVSPSTLTSSGPFDVKQVTVTLDRSTMPSGRNHAEIVLAASGVPRRTVYVRANTPVVAEFTADTTLALAGADIQFIDQSEDTVSPEDTTEEETGAKVLVSWLWDFGDGTQSTARNPVHQYALGGSYTVSLTASNGTDTETETKEDFITVFGENPPTAAFSGTPTTVTSGQTVAFTDESDPGSRPIAAWLWDFGDLSLGTDRFEQNPSHIYTVAGATEQYTVSLTVTSALGSDTATKAAYITVTPTKSAGGQGQGGSHEGSATPPAPTADFHAAYPWDAPFKWFLTGEEVAFVNETAGEASSYLWEFGDGLESPEEDAVHVYVAANPPGYSVRLKAAGPGGTSSVLGDDVIHVFSETELDAFVRSEDAAYEAALPASATYEGPGYATYRLEMASQCAAGLEGPEVLQHALSIGVPEQASSTALLLLAGEERISSVAEAMLGPASVSAEMVTVVLADAPGQGTDAAVAVIGIVAAMDAAQELVPGITNFILVGKDDAAWVAWLCSALDQRISGLLTAGIDPVNVQGVALPGVGSIDAYAARVQIPIEGVQAVPDLVGVAGVGTVPLGSSAGTLMVNVLAP